MREEVFIMNRIALGGIVAATVAVGALAAATPATAAPNCVAQSIQCEHDVYGTAWGHDVVGFLASHPEVLQEFGFRSFGELARFSAAQDPEACPPGL
jgi:hypothetical protein